MNFDLIGNWKNNVTVLSMTDYILKIEVKNSDIFTYNVWIYTLKYKILVYRTADNPFYKISEHLEYYGLLLQKYGILYVKVIPTITTVSSIIFKKRMRSISNAALVDQKVLACSWYNFCSIWFQILIIPTRLYCR